MDQKGSSCQIDALMEMGGIKNWRTFHKKKKETQSGCL